MTATTTEHQTGAEVVAHAVLGLAATRPGQFGRLRTARMVGGYAVPIDDDSAAEIVAQTSVVERWSLREIVALIDALLAGGLMAQTAGVRPTLVLTRAGHRALDALETDRPRLTSDPS